MPSCLKVGLCKVQRRIVVPKLPNLAELMAGEEGSERGDMLKCTLTHRRTAILNDFCKAVEHVI